MRILPGAALAMAPIKKRGGGVAKRRGRGGGKKRRPRRRKSRQTRRRPARRRRKPRKTPIRRLLGRGGSTVKKAEVMLPLLQSLQDFKPANRRSILLSHLDDETCEMLYETIANVIQNEAIPPVTRARLRKALAPHKGAVRYIADKSKPPALKKKKMVQMGGFVMSAIIGAAIPLLVDLVAKAFAKRKKK